jgi:hypothetical protein
MAAIAAVAAVISYSDGLFLVRQAGNRDWHAYLYPLLPDGLIVICLIALLAAAGDENRPGWPMWGLGLGIALTLSMNVAAGVAHSPLDAVVDGSVPVVFFVAVEVFIGYVRRGREDASPRSSRPLSRTVPADVRKAAEACMQATFDAGNPLSQHKLKTQFRLSRAEAAEIWQPYNVPAGGPAAATPAPAGAQNGHGGNA